MTALPPDPPPQLPPPPAPPAPRPAPGPLPPSFPPLPATPPEVVRAGRAVVLLVGGVVTAALILFSALHIAGALGHQDVVEPVSFPAGIGRVVVSVDTGWAEIHGTDGPEVRGERHLSLGFERPAVTERIEGETLRISATCGPVLSHWCGASYDLEVPRSVSVDVESSSGHVTVEGIDGDVRARAHAGHVIADDIGGTLDARTSAGGIEGSGLRGADVTAQTQAGSVVLGFVAAPGSVTARSSAGRVQIDLPRDDRAYRVDASSSVGEPDVAVDTSPTSDRVITASSSAGSVEVGYADR
jgi:hypothetical protein